MKSKRLEIRLTNLEKEYIKLTAKKSGLSASEYILNLALNKQVTPKPLKEEIQAILILKEYRTNFARISNLIKNKESIAGEVKEVIALIDTTLKNLKK